MHLIILCGPTGTGKNTVAEIVAQQRERCAIVDFDMLRNMFRKPHLTPWDGEAGQRQNNLGAEHACMVATSLLTNGYDCIVLDVLNDQTAALYRERLERFDPLVVQLLPTYEEIVRRNGTRSRRLTDAELRMVYESQAEVSDYDVRIDNTHLSPEETAKMVLDLMA